MADATAMLEKELADVRKELAGYDDLKEREQRLSQAIAVLNGNTPIAPGRPPGRTRRTLAPIDEGQIIHIIHAAGEPQGAVYIREQLGEPDSNRLSIKLKAMVDAGVLKRIGSGRASKYDPVS